MADETDKAPDVAVVRPGFVPLPGKADGPGKNPGKSPFLVVAGIALSVVGTSALLLATTALALALRQFI